MLRHSMFYILAYFAGLIIQFSWMRFFAPWGIAPSLIMIFVIFIGLRRGSFAGQLMGFAWGLSWDVISVDLFGANACMLTILGYLAGFLSRKWNESKLASQIMLTGIASLFFSAGIWTLYQIFGADDVRFLPNYIILLQPLYNMAVAPVIFWLGDHLEAYFFTEFERF